MERWDSGKALDLRQFSRELKAAFPGRSILPPMNLGPDGTIEFLEGATEEEIAAIKELVAAHDLSEPLAPNGSAFAAAIFAGLTGKTSQDKLERGIVLMNLSPKVLNFINLLDVATPSATRLIILRAAWASIVSDDVIGLGGSAEGHLGKAEAAAIEELGVQYGVPLAA